jgi:hypothetical protein
MKLNPPILTFAIILLLIFTVPVAAVITPVIEPTINPAASDSFLCDIPILNGFINSCEGRTAAAGAQGPPGPAGSGNTTIFNYFNLSTGNFSSISNLTNFINYTFSEMNQTPNQTAGPPGAQGPPGEQGIQGIQGIQGETGAANMTAGPQGSQGDPGINGTAGAQGPPGEQGIQGIQGIQGETGAANMTAGPQGPQGDPGINGTAGAQGPPGEQGIQGIQGIQGETGAANMTAGPQGSQGDPGINGTAGAQGPPGEQGIQGIQGIQGETGAANMTPGPQGIPGPMDDNVFLKNGTRAMTANISMGSNYINNLITGLLGSDATNKTYVDSRPDSTYNASYLTSSFNSTYDAKPASIPDQTQFPFLNGTRSFTANVSMGSQYINNLLTGSQAGDVVNRSYVDTKVSTSNTSYVLTNNATYAQISQVWVSYTPTYTWTVAPASPSIGGRWSQIGKIVYFQTSYSSADSNAGTLQTFTLPKTMTNSGIAAATVGGFVQNTNLYTVSSGVAYIGAGTPTVCTMATFPTTINNEVVAVYLSGFYEVTT